MRGYSSTKDQDSVISVQTPEGISFEVHPAGIMVRLCAFLLDGTIQGILYLILAVLFAMFFQNIGTWIMLLAFFILNWFYHVLFELFNNGMSPGKMVMGLRVLSSNGSPVQPGASLIRNLLRFADSFFYLYLIGLLSISISSGFRRLGDIAAGTLVVYRFEQFTSPLYTAKNSGEPRLEIHHIHTLSYQEKQAILSFTHRYPLLGPLRAHEIAQPFVAELDRSQKDNAAAFLISLAEKVQG